MQADTSQLICLLFDCKLYFCKMGMRFYEALLIRATCLFICLFQLSIAVWISFINWFVWRKRIIRNCRNSEYHHCTLRSKRSVIDERKIHNEPLLMRLYCF